MRRYVQILGLVMLSLAASGWGAVFAAVLCPHANSSTARNAPAAHAHHQAKPEKAASPRCHDSAMEQETEVEAEPSPVTPGNAGDGTALALPQSLPCTHCLSSPEAPASTATIARQQSEQRRDLGPAALQASMPAAPVRVFANPVLYRQGAPPAPHIPTHLLAGVLLI